MNEDIIISIEADINRTFNNSKIMTPKILFEVLKVFAYRNEEIGYCQGINYIAGFLIIINNNEADAYKCLQQLIDNYGMKGLYILNVPLLGECFYKLDKLIFKMHPDLYEWFRIINIFSKNFSSPWLITIFTHTLQYIKNNMPTEIIITIWDHFLIDGWKAILKICIFFLNQVKDILINNNMDEMLNVFKKIDRKSVV